MTQYSLVQETLTTIARGLNRGGRVLLDYLFAEPDYGDSTRLWFARDFQPVPIPVRPRRPY